MNSESKIYVTGHRGLVGSALCAALQTPSSRPRVPDELNEDIAWRIGRAFAAELNPRTVPHR